MKLYKLLRPRKFRLRRLIIPSLIIYVIWYVVSSVLNPGDDKDVPIISELTNGYKYTNSYKFSKEEEKTIKQNVNDIYNYTGESSIIINDNTPFFTGEELALCIESFENYGELDSLGRCSSVMACLSRETMPSEGEKRGEIGMIKPTGWHTIKYDCIEDRYLFNRCHLIGWQLGAENANEKNLITGTRYMNLEMTESENLVANYIRKTGNHVLYRVTPIFKDDDLVCRGLLMEAKSIEDDKISFCRFYYNVQPGIEINYATGESSYSGNFLDRSGQSVIVK